MSKRQGRPPQIVTDPSSTCPWRKVPRSEQTIGELLTVSSTPQTRGELRHSVEAIYLIERHASTHGSLDRRPDQGPVRPQLRCHRRQQRPRLRDRPPTRRTGAKVVLAGRSEVKGWTLSTVKPQARNPLSNSGYWTIADLDSVRAFAPRYEHPVPYVLVNRMFPARALTAGLRVSVFATNHLGTSH